MSWCAVALHPEGVDRNPGTMPVVDGDIDVALHPEGVDRNRIELTSRQNISTSPSIRKAWIEI